jgi:hypothetical protein
MEDFGILRIMMEIKRALLIVIIMCFVSSCGYKSISGKVIDAETDQPVEGAVVLVEWTKTKGLGLTHTEVYKVDEKLTDKEGKVTIDDVSDIFVDPPGVTVYKKGYVAWNNEHIFPSLKKRTDFKWKNGYVFKLERFKPEYSYVEHDSFVSSAIHGGSGSERKKLFKKIYRESEGTKVRAELNKRLENGGQK